MPDDIPHDKHVMDTAKAAADRAFFIDQAVRRLTPHDKHVILKYALPFQADTFLDMPEGAEVLTVQVHEGQPILYVLVDPTNEVRRVRFTMVLTGKPFDATHAFYVGTFQIMNAGLVFHLFRDSASIPART
jgi:hypothetical protein